MEKIDASRFPLSYLIALAVLSEFRRDQWVSMYEFRRRYGKLVERTALGGVELPNRITSFKWIEQRGLIETQQPERNGDSALVRATPSGMDVLEAVRRMVEA